MSHAINRLLQHVFQDKLTGVYNRAFFDQALKIEQAQAKRYKRPLTLMLIDLDKFKPINDLYGHKVGDQYLRKTAVLLQKGLRETDVISRYGGDEFVALLPETDEKTAEKVVQRLKEVFAKNPFIVKKKKIPIHYSLGMKTESKNFEKLLQQADTAMYKEKRGKR
ncbi:MAG: GGDEF domain-containing protein [Candidatus Diapherotrites archaeon]